MMNYRRNAGAPQALRLPKVRGIGTAFQGVKVFFCLSSLFFSLSSRGASHSGSSIGEIFADLKKQTINKSYEIQMAEATASQKSAQVYTAWTRWFPHVDLQLSQSRSKDYSIITSGSLGTIANLFTPQDISLSRWALNVTFPIYQRAVQLELQESLAEKSLFHNQLQMKLTELNWKMRSHLGNYLLQAYEQATIGASIDIAQSNLREAELRFGLGQKTKVDVLRAKANLIQLESTQVTTQQKTAVALGDLLEYTGLTHSDLKETGLTQMVQSEKEIAQAVDEFTNWDSLLPPLQPYLNAEFNTDWPANKGRPTLEGKIAESSLSYKNFLAEQDLADARARKVMIQEWPDLKLQGTLNKQSNNWNDAISPEYQSYSVAVLLTIPLFSGGSAISSFLQKQYAQEANRLKSEKDLLHLRNEVEKERIEIRSLLKSVEAQKLIREQHEEIVRLSFKSYQLGKTTMVELLGSQNDFTTAKVNLAKTKINIAVLMRELAWNLGVILE